MGEGRKTGNDADDDDDDHDDDDHGDDDGNDADGDGDVNNDAGENDDDDEDDDGIYAVTQLPEPLAASIRCAGRILDASDSRPDAPPFTFS